MYREIPKFQPDEILVYLRKSRSDDQSLTVEEVLQRHEAKILEWIERNLDAPIPEENWYREVVSGETIQDRVEFQKILRRIESPKIKAVLCVECVRLSRGDLEDCGRIIKIFRYTSTYVITTTGERIYDLRDEFDREGFERELKHGNYYLEYSKTIMKRGMDYTVKAGGYVASIPPYGYKKTRVLVGKKKLPTLEIAEEEANTVRNIFDWYVNEDIGFRTIADRLDEMGVMPTMAHRWCPQSVKKILENEHYLGKIRYYGHKMEHIVVNQEIIKKRVATDNYELFDGLHPAIIDEETFYKASKKRMSYKPRVKKYTVLRNPLASILYCECGYAMTYAVKREIPRFECPESRRCRTSSIDAKELLSMIQEALLRNIEDIEVQIDDSNEDVVKKHEEKIANLEKRLKDIEYKELSLWEKYTEDKMPKSVFDNLRVKCETEKENAEKMLADAISEKPQRIDYKKNIATLHEAIEGISDDSISAETKNKLLKACIERISYSRGLAVRGSMEDVKEGQTYERGWIQSEPTIDITLRL